MTPTHFHLRPWEGSVDYTVDGQSRRRHVSYVKEPTFRAAVMELTQAVVESQQRGPLFANVCGQCGNSCRRPSILVREGEIFALQSLLGIDQNTFRDRYLEPAFTWNAGDGIFRQPNGHCPFLSSDGTDRPLNAGCTVYEARPQSCREFKSTADFCRKDMGVIMQDLGSLCVHPTQMHAALRDGTSVTLPTDPVYWERLCEAFQTTSDPPASEAAAEEPSAPPPAAPRPAGLEWLILGETAMALKLAGRAPLPLALDPTRAEVQALLAAILQRPDAELQKYLGSPDPECLMCGECCRAFELEIMPFDVQRLANVLHLTPEHFVEHRTRPGRFSWNPHNRILNKKTVPRYSKRLAELRVLGENEEMCQFLERRDNGYYLCSVYEHRPQMCRIFPATHELCRTTNAVANWGRQAQNLSSVLLTAETFFLQAVGHDGVQQYPRQHWPEADAAARALEEAVVALATECPAG